MNGIKHKFYTCGYFLRCDNRNISKYCTTQKLFVNSTSKHVNFINLKQLSQLTTDLEVNNKLSCNVTEAKNVSGNNQLNIPDFGNYKEAFRSKSLLELIRAFVIFKLCTFETLVNHQLQIFKWLRKFTGKRLYTAILKASIYGQFLGGETRLEVIRQVQRNTKYGIVPMIAYTASEQHGPVNIDKDSEALKTFFQANAQAISTSIEMAAEMKGFSELQPMCSSKMTFLKPAEVLRDASELILLNRKTITQFITSEDSSVEAKEFMALVKECVRKTNMISIEGALMHLQFHFLMAEMAGTSFKDFKNDLAGINLCKDEVSHAADILVQLGKKAEKEGVSMIWDTEQTYLNPAIDILALDAMRVCNRDTPSVHNTYQCYLKNTYSDVLCDTSIAKEEGFCWGGKIVRGGYIDEERLLAVKYGYEDPVHPTYEATTENYYKVINYLLNEVQQRPRGSIKMTVATHNADTVSHVLQRLNEEGLSPGNEIKFAQLRGMRDYISFTLGQAGIPVAKLVHYGPVEDCVAYISRRVKENRGTFATADFERELLGKELKRRLTMRNK